MKGHIWDYRNKQLFKENKSTHIQIRINKKKKEMLKKYCEEKGTTLSDVLESAIDEILKQK